ncbi:hypothetical protein [Qipengyuania sphaerica]|uniref:hypothetical protein n=1 Tax=Qipengyuania sphaerica TaxID=2867243 RepID=UPI001C87AF73|nr:hypothetical protein [Qipengyuania sphaerica]MBX7540908.1 hypothetical protein [Qipengyuania sphaerica]
MKKRRILPIMLLAATGSLAANGSVALATGAETAIIMSSAEGALLPPDRWNCDLYVSEYDKFIADGNKPELWRFFGKRYRVDTSGDDYDWSMWLAWRENQNCGGLSPVKQAGQGAQSGTGGSGGSGGGFGGMTAVGIVGGLLATGAVAAGGGGGGDSEPKAKSPG